MYTKKYILFMCDEAESKFKELCGLGEQYELKQELDIDSLVHEAILAIHYDDITALSCLFKKFPEILEAKIRTLLTTAANHNKTQCIEYLLQQRGANPKELEGSSAYSAFEGVKRLFDEKQHRLNWAVENKNNDNYGIKANALYILYTYYLAGWCGLARDPIFAKKCLKKSAKLGHARAIYDFAKEALFPSEIEQSKQYIDQALQQNKLNDTSFDFNDYKQESMKKEIEGLLEVMKTTASRKLLT